MIRILSTSCFAVVGACVMRYVTLSAQTQREVT